MTDKEYKFQKQRIRKLIKKWVRPSGFSWWLIDFVYSRDYHPEHSKVAGETHATWRYSQASITYYLPVVATFNDEELENVFVHELCHLPMSAMPLKDNDEAHDIWERAVDDFAKHMVWAREAGAKDA